MKKIIYFVIAVILVVSSCAKDEQTEQTGGIYGVITDKATGEPIRSAGVQLNPLGLKTVTGSEGQYEFTELKAGSYSLQVSKTSYTDLVNYSITVVAGKTAKGDVQIEKLPAALKVVNDNKQDIDTLDFGSAKADITRSFGIFNDGPESLTWAITETGNWITKVSTESGTLKSGATQAVVITINRDSLNGGENKTTIHVTSDNGSKQLTVKAIGENKTLPTLNTLEATDITATTAIFHGQITATGLPAYTERGFVYSASSMPTIESTIAKLTVAVTENTEYAANVTGLTVDQTYYVRAYAINSLGTAYSTNEFVFSTVVGMPSVSTQDITNKNIAAGTLTFNGTITAVGDPAYTERGFVYGTTHNPTIDDTKKVASGTGTGAFSVNATGIQEGSLYYARAYATNVKGTVYGSEVSFDFNAAMPVVETKAATNKNIGAGTATFNGKIVSVGDLAYTERGFVYAPTSNPTIEDTKRAVSGTGTGDFNLNITGLEEGNIYYIRAYVTNSKGTVYGDNVTLDFYAVMPTLNTQAVTNINIGAGTATFNGTILTIGDPAYTERGFVYGTTHNPTIDDNKKTVSGTGTGVFSANITGLTVDQTYYVRAYAKNNNGAVYGEEVSLVFNASMPVVSTQEVTAINIGAGTATFNGTIVNIGDPAYTERGFVYGTTHNPTIDDNKKTVSGTGTGAFSANITGLTVDQTYYVRAYATNSKGTTYGEEVNFILTAALPSVSTQEVTAINIGAGMATFNGTIVSIGDPAYTERGFAYGTTHNPTFDNIKKVAQGNGTGVFSVNVTDIVEGSVYYVRAYATNSKGMVYSAEDVAFDFNAAMPTLTTQAATNINIGAGTATFNGTIVSAGDLAITERGFVYATTHNPTTTDTKIVATGSATGAFSANVTNIAIGNTYYVRAYATNSKGTVYGTEVTFDFHGQAPYFNGSYNVDVTNINRSAGTATFTSVGVYSGGNPAYTERGFVYATTQNPTINDTKIVVAGSGTGSFSANVTNIEMGHTYYVRAFATNAVGTAYSNQYTLDFNAQLPTFSTTNVTNKSITNGTVTFNSSIYNVGDPAYSERGFVYGTNTNPTIESNTKTVVAGTGTGAYSANLSGFTQGTVYYMRGYATSSEGTAYSGNVTVDFNPVLPTVTTGYVTNLGSTTATFNGNITNAGDPVYTEKGFVYSTAQNPDITNGTKVIVSGSGTGAYTANVTGLSFDVRIYVRAYATCASGTRYGSQDYFQLSHSEILAIPALNLMVTKSDIGGMINWTNANTQCSNLTLGGYSDWRLPTITELTAMYNGTRPPNLNIWHGVEYPIGVTFWEVWDFYWSSTASGTQKTLLTFYNGSQLTESPSANRQYDTGSHDYSNFYCRCVRTLP